MDGRTAAAALGVGPQATRDEIRRAFRARAKVLHPDAGSAGSTERFITLRRAVERLLADAPATPTPTANTAAPAPAGPSAAPTGFDGFAAPTVPKPGNGATIDLTDAIRRRRGGNRSPGRRRPVTRDARGLSFEDHLAAALSRG